MVFEKNFIIIVFYLLINMYLLKEIFLVLSVYGRDVVMGNLDLWVFLIFILFENCFLGYEWMLILIE